MKMAPLGIFLVALAACNGSDDKSGDTDVTNVQDDADADTDSDTDSDTDADTDADADADADADTDADTDTASTADTGGPFSCAEASAVGALPIVLTGSTPGQGNDESASCGGQPSPDVLVDFTAPSAGRYGFSLAGSNYDGVVYVLDGCGGAELGCNDDPDEGEDGIAVELLAGQRVIVGVDGSLGDSGDYTLTVDTVAANETACTDGVDDDLDGDVDCFDIDCVAVPACIESVCTGGLDEDGDFLTDCLDPNCVADPACAPVCPEGAFAGDPPGATGTTFGAGDESAATCGGAGASDIAVEFTAPAAGRYLLDDIGTVFDAVLSITDGCGGAELACSDGAGVGADSLVVDLLAGQTVVAVIDGADPSASGDFTLTATPVPSVETDCADGVDEDFDVLADCDDADCGADPACFETLCTNGADDDGDLAIDCGDADCAIDAACLGVCPEAVLAVGTPVYGDTTGMADDYTPNALCTTPSLAGDFSVEFTAPSNAMWAFSTYDSAHIDTALVVYATCAGGPELACNDDIVAGVQRWSQVVVPIPAGNTVVVVVDGWDVTEGPFVLSVGPTGGAELCTDGVDNDLNGAFDCDDFACAADPAC